MKRQTRYTDSQNYVECETHGSFHGRDQCREVGKRSLDAGAIEDSDIEDSGQQRYAFHEGHFPVAEWCLSLTDPISGKMKATDSSTRIVDLL